VCNANASSVDLPAGSEITFNTPNQTPDIGEVNDGGTFFVTTAAIVTGDAGCTNTNLYSNITVQAIAPAKVGTLGPSEGSGASGQPYILGTGDSIFVNANGALSVAKNSYGTGSASNSCTPVDTAHNLPDVFGETDPPFTQYSTTLQASTGGRKNETKKI